MRLPHRHLVKLFGWTVLLAPSPALAVAAGPPAQEQAQLDAVRAHIGALGAQMGAELQQRDALSAQLRDVELTIAQTRKRLDARRSEREIAEKRRSELHAQQQACRDRLDTERSSLSRQIRAAYEIGAQEQIKLLLNQQSPALFGRMLTYYGYFGRQRAVQIDTIDRDLDRLKLLDESMRLQSDKLHTVDIDLQHQLKVLEAVRSRRRAVVAMLGARVRDENQQISRLNQEQKATESLLASLRRALPDYSMGEQQPFEQMKGKLPMPVAGRVAARFHQLRAGSHNDSVRWNGILIDTERGAKVRAPYYGRVVFADWLQGLGLLLIIEHDNGYMSLFGHCEVLYKSVGESVAPGDAIAATGEGGTPQLYFEIRQGRTPIDPQSWVK